MIESIAQRYHCLPTQVEDADLRLLRHVNLLAYAESLRMQANGVATPFAEDSDS